MRVVLLVLVPALAWGQTCPEPADPCDVDEDGWSVADGDCDDEDAGRNPGLEEICDDGVDQDCTNVVDDGCDVKTAELLGGTGCGARGSWTALLPLPIFFLRKRR